MYGFCQQPEEVQFELKVINTHLLIVFKVTFINSLAVSFD